ncbi:hypothetical protein [Streptomyces sp. NPDC050528]|uniref:hypothetical protein n=1 Tax=unclassified Streptomyces TaxID=2593676 RepID=UPI0037A9BAE8
MTEILEFPVLLRLIGERSAAFRAAVASAPSLDVQVPTSGAVARHQVQEAKVHTYDAEVTVGAPQPLPDEAALDGVDEFLSSRCAGTDPWPHEPATVEHHAPEGRSWRLSLSAADARATGTGEAPDAAGATFRGTAAELFLVLYGRIPVGPPPTSRW